MSLSKLLLIALAVPLFLAACGPAGGLHASVSDPSTGLTQKNYSKYFDDGQWLLKDKVGISVVVDNETPLGRQMFGGVTGKDSEGTGKVTVYFWNFDHRQHRVGKLRVSHRGKGGATQQSSMLPAASPWSRTEVKFGEIPIDPYATELDVEVSVEVDGKTVMRPMTLKRRTVEENQRFFGRGGKPPYPWAEKL